MKYEKGQFEAVIFDFGGVIIDVDYERTSTAFQQILGDSRELGYSQMKQSKIFDELETGQISEAQFRDGMRSLAKLPHLSDEAIDAAWNAMLGAIPSYRVNFLEDIARYTKIFLLSNTNSIHLKAIEVNMIAASGSRKQFEALFERVYYSHIMGKRKPNADAFQELIDNHNLEPAKTLFIDDSPQHVEGARKVGLKAHHLINDVTTIWH